MTKLLQIAIVVLSTLFVISTQVRAASENVNADPLPACSSSLSGAVIIPNFSNTVRQCGATPSSYSITVYEMGVCTSHPYGASRDSSTFDASTCEVVYSDAVATSTDIAGSIGTTSSLPGTSTLPPPGTYGFPYILFKNEFKVSTQFDWMGIHLQGPKIIPIEKNDINEIKSELGDLLLQVVLISQIASDQGDFNFDDVADEISQKIIRRHPQIFDENYKINDLPQESWERIKNLEKKNKNKSNKNTLDQIENNMPTILKSLKIQKKAASLNFDWISKDQVLEKVDEELNELKDALKEKNNKNIEDELGDLFFTLISLSRHLNLDPDQTLKKANQKFIKRFNKMENIIEDKKLKWHNLKAINFKNLWNNAKRLINED